MISIYEYNWKNCTVTATLTFEPEYNIYYKNFDNSEFDTYTFYYNSNNSIKVTQKTPTRTGYKFLGWSTRPNESTPEYIKDKTYTFEETIEDLTNQYIKYFILYYSFIAAIYGF